jgi:hypothetical protein
LKTNFKKNIVMKKLNIVIALIISGFVLNTYAAETTLTAGQSVSVAFSAAANGDVITLSQSGDYTWTNQLSVTTPKSITIRAAAGLLTRPVIKVQGSTAGVAISFMMFYNAGTSGGVLVLDGVEFDGNDKLTSSVVAVKVATGNNLNIRMKNCLVRNTYNAATSLAPVFTYSNTATNPNPDSLYIENSTFIASQLGFKTSGVIWTSGVGRPKNAIFKNCYFKGPFEKMAIANAGTGATNGVETYLIDHCTFDGMSGKDIQLANTATGTSVVRNSLFINNTGAVANDLGTGGDYKTSCGIFGAANFAITYTASLMDGTTLLTDPVLSTGGHFATDNAYITPGGTDGLPIGYYAASGITTKVNTNVANDTYMSVSQVGQKLMLNGTSTTGTYRIFDVNGNSVASGIYTNSTISLKNSTKGLYLLKTNNQTLKFILK